MAEKVLLVLVERKGTAKRFIDEDSHEMAELVGSAGGVIMEEIRCMIERPVPASFIGSGKLEELKQKQLAHRTQLVIFNIDLSPVQARNIETACGGRVVDRTGLILDIFARRARSSEGRLQVDLAQMNYLMPRLVGKGVLLSRLGGGIGTRGPGEQKLELDRRRIRERIARIKRDLEKVSVHRGVVRKSRQRKQFQLVAIVGYTNAGKSSLLNALTGSDSYVENRLFATLDPMTRALRNAGHDRILLTDTVGFLKKLPHHLIEAFKATLEEVTEADALIHVVDAADEFCDDHFRTVNILLEELGAHQKPTLIALNKTDLLNQEQIARKERMFPGGVSISIKTGSNISVLPDKIEQLLKTKDEDAA